MKVHKQDIFLIMGSCLNIKQTTGCYIMTCILKWQGVKYRKGNHNQASTIFNFKLLSAETRWAVRHRDRLLVTGALRIITIGKVIKQYIKERKHKYQSKIRCHKESKIQQ